MPQREPSSVHISHDDVGRADDGDQIGDQTADGHLLERLAGQKRRRPRLDADGPITAVRLVKANLKDDDLKWIAAIPTMELLDLSETPVTAAGLQHLAAAPKLEFLHLGKSKITNDKLQAVAALKGLRQLYLNDCDLAEASLDLVAGLPKLTSLALYGSTVKDEQLECLHKFPSLQTLNLMGTGVTDKSVPHLLRTRLSGLQIQATKISQEGVARLRVGLPKCPGNSIVNN